MPRFHPRIAVLPVVFLLAAASTAQFTINNSRIPGGSANNSSTENVDFGDVDLDGDWDIVMADGGDDGNDQNRIWINAGGLQPGTVGNYSDETATRFPSVSDDSRDIEFVDFDADGDLDIYTSNTAQLTLQGNRWWTNLGGEQAGSLGFYGDETATRWVNLGVNNATTNSSIAPNQVINGTFIDWSCDCDFGDLDNDGDMDLVHSSYGGSFEGEVPTRIFLNDGDGHYEEFNPSNFTVFGQTIDDFDPGLWCDGDQRGDTTNTTGQFCDIASSALDIDIGDIDGDFDLDILHGARNEAPRMFANRLDGSSLAPAVGGGALGFRDVTGAVFPNGYYEGDFGHYEQEMGDFDGDGDLDIYGLNWNTVGFNFEDHTMRNNGDGTFASPVALPNSGDDDNEADFFDADNDGDLDIWVADFSGQDRLYLNTNGNGNFASGSVPSFTAVSLDADICDIDNDGDYDVLVAEDNFQPNTFLENTSQTPDTTPPYLPHVEDVGDQLAGAGPIPVRAHVYDNAPYYITWYNTTWVELAVDGIPLPSVPAVSSGGQIFRAELPGNLVGNVGYRFASSDFYGNTGRSATVLYRGRGRSIFRSLETPSEAPVFLGSRAQTGAETKYGAGTRGSRGVPELDALTVLFPDAPLYLVGHNVPPNTPFVAWITTAPADRRVGGLGRMNVGGAVLRRLQGLTDAQGRALIVGGTTPAELAPGTELFVQFAALDGVDDRWAVSRGVRLTSQ